MTDWPSAERPPADPGSDNRVRLGFERQSVTVRVDQIVPLKTLRDGVRESRKYAQIVSSIKAIGLVEAPAVVPNPKNPEQYFLLDGHLRIEVLKQIGIETVECLVANDDETYTYNKRVNRLPPIQEHRMIVRAIERGVTEAVIADALGLEVGSIRARFRLLDGICEETADMLKDTNCSMRVFDMLRRMSPMRQNGLVTVLCRSPERLELATGDGRDDQAFRRVQARGSADCADQRVAARPGRIGFGNREVDAGQVAGAVSAIRSGDSAAGGSGTRE
jgi:hypothetical protein